MNVLNSSSKNTDRTSVFLTSKADKKTDRERETQSYYPQAWDFLRS